MGETKDPRKALQDPSVAVRAAAARDLSRIGAFADLAPLVEMAVEQKSSALRLYAAAAAADILHRYRGVRGGPKLKRSQVEQVHQWVRSFDPGRNPGLLSMLSAVPDQASRTRLARMLRDPRNGVRAGALVALRRMALSAAAFDDEGVPATVGECLLDKRMTPDVTLDLIKLAGQLGWQTLRDAIRQAAGHGRLHGEASQQALRRLDARKDLATWDGLWVDDGLDVFEIGEAQADGPWRLIGAAGVSTGGTPASLEVDAESGRARIAGQEEPVRLLWVARLGQEEPRRALQQGHRTWWELGDKALLDGLARVVDEAEPGIAPALRPFSDTLVEVEGTVAPRVRAMILWRSGDLEAALALLEELTSTKKPRADLYYWLARVQADLGRPEEAKANLAEFLDKAGKKSRYREAGEALLASLGG